MLNAKNKEFSYQRELQRKLIHLSSLWIPLAMYYLPMIQCFILFSFALFGLLTLQYFCRKNLKCAAWIMPLLRQEEKIHSIHFTGAIQLLLAAMFCILIFRQSIAITALSITLIADATAALVGKKWGKTALFEKSYEGTLAFLISAWLVMLGIAHIENLGFCFIFSGTLAAFTATIAELFSRKIKLDDNLTISITAASTLWLALHFCS